MDAGIKTVEELLHGSCVFLVPHFQRSYSWGLKQWQRLWSDVLSIDADAAKKHFIGPLVCAPLRQLPGDNLTKFEVIDGQQRLTTLSVLFGALRDVAREAGDNEWAAQLTEDYLLHHRRKDALRFKLVPRTSDRGTWQRLVEENSGEDNPESAIDDAWEWFRQQAQAQLSRKGIAGLKSLQHAVGQRIAFVAITIADENPYRVFESLNTTGLALTEFDLVRNHLFMKVPVGEQEDFDQNHWRAFEKLWDDCTGKEGAAGREATFFLRQFLMRRAGHFSKGETFVQFRSWADAGSATAAEIVGTLTKSARFARRFRDIEGIRDRRNAGEGGADWPTDAVDQRLLQLAYCDARTAMPILLDLMDRHDRGDLSRDELLLCLQDLVSLLIRRSIAGEKTKNYDKKFVEVARRIEAPVRETLERELHRLGWPTDTPVLLGLAHYPIYRSEPGKARLMLEEIERAHGHKEPVQLARLQLEHVLPQTLSGKDGDSWRAALGDRPDVVHAELVHTLGNLTLTGYNQTLSNRSFSAKQEELARSTLQLNRPIAEAPKWNGEMIVARTREIGGRILAMFPVVGQAPAPAAKTPEHRTERIEHHRAFWKKLVDGLASEDGPAYAGRPSGLSYIRTPTDYRCLRMILWFDQSNDLIGVWATFIGTEGNLLFPTVQTQKAEVEVRLGMSIGEQGRVRGSPPHFRIEKSNAGLSTPAGEDAAIDWLKHHARALRKAVEPCLAALNAHRAQPKVGGRHDLRLAWWQSLLPAAQERTKLHAGCTPRTGTWFGAPSGVPGLSYNYVVNRNSSRAEVWFRNDPEDPARSKRRFDWFQTHRATLDAAIPGLTWERLEHRQGCRIATTVPGGYRNPKDEWPAAQARVIDAMIALHKHMQPHIDGGEVGKI